MKLRRPTLSRFKFKVTRPGTHEIVIEQLAATREWARCCVVTFAELYWPGSEVEP